MNYIAEYVVKCFIFFLRDVCAVYLNFSLLLYINDTVYYVRCNNYKVYFQGKWHTTDAAVVILFSVIIFSSAAVVSTVTIC